MFQYESMKNEFKIKFVSKAKIYHPKIISDLFNLNKKDMDNQILTESE